MQLETVGEIVRLLRSRRRLEQVELARACGWRDASAVSRIETDRVSPTRRTLLKLSESLAHESTASFEEVRSWLFLAAGILPTREDVAAIASALPAIEGWSQPAVVMDFGWNIWRANSYFLRWSGIPADHVGRNMVTLLFSEPVRAYLGTAWEIAGRELIAQFRAETVRRTEQRWHRALITLMNLDPDFARFWHETPVPEARGLYLRERPSKILGNISIIRLTLTADPRLTLTQMVPEDPLAAKNILGPDPA